MARAGQIGFVALADADEEVCEAVVETTSEVVALALRRGLADGGTTEPVPSGTELIPVPLLPIVTFEGVGAPPAQ